MIKMILADDEPVIIKGIQKLVDWTSLGIDVVGEFCDGKSALEGIIRLKPDLALIDIFMPGMTGVELLKECRLLELPTKIIFISGFQDFEYAKAALKYGAVDYLLKPVICSELLGAVEKCMMGLRQEQNPPELEAQETEEKKADYSRLISLEESCYVPAYVEILSGKEESLQVRKLTRFSVISFLEEYLEERRLGITFTRKDHIVVIFKGMDRGRSREEAYLLCQAAKERLRCELGFVIGEQVEHMSQIPGGFEGCLGMKSYFFFAPCMENRILMQGEPVFSPLGDQTLFFQMRDRMISAIIAQNPQEFRECFDQYGKLLCRVADGKKEDACFYFCSVVRELDEKFHNLGLPSPSIDIRTLLEQGRTCGDFEKLRQMYRAVLESYLQKLQQTIVNNDKKDFLKAKAYIEEHYNENITLNILADVVHMNSYYFSSFFKKHAGVNFKDYVNKIRIQHAVSLLVGTDMKLSEIADQAGFGDARSFSENFSRIYHETPNAYRKKAGKNGE